MQTPMGSGNSSDVRSHSERSKGVGPKVVGGLSEGGGRREEVEEENEENEEEEENEEDEEGLRPNPCGKR